MSQDLLKALARQHDSLLAIVFDRAAMHEPLMYACCTSCQHAWIYIRGHGDWCDADYKHVHNVVKSQLPITTQN